MKMPEPVAWIYTSKLGGNQSYLTRYASDLTTYKAEKVAPLYTKQALIDLLEEAAMRAWSHYASACFAAGIDPSTQEQFLASDAIRKLKETL